MADRAWIANSKPAIVTAVAAQNDLLKFHAFVAYAILDVPRSLQMGCTDHLQFEAEDSCKCESLSLAFVTKLAPDGNERAQKRMTHDFKDPWWMDARGILACGLGCHGFPRRLRRGWGGWYFVAAGARRFIRRRCGGQGDVLRCQSFRLRTPVLRHMHVASRAFTADPATDHGLPVPLGGAHMDQTGFRNAPSLAYASFTPPFSIGDGPTGGFFRDGRASSLAAQAQQPFVTTSFEMANLDAAEVVGRLQQSAVSLDKFIAAYGAAALNDPDTALRDMGLAIAAYETEDEDFHPFTSKFDYWLQGRAVLTAQEQQGMALFNNPGKGNCTACHPSQRQQFDSHALFTDFSFDNIGVPRNWAIPANNASTPIPAGGSAGTAVAPVDVPADAEYAFY